MYYYILIKLINNILNNFLGEDEKAIEEKTFNIKIVDKKLSEDELMMTTIAFLMAGFETTATTLTFASYEMATNPSVQQRLYEEVNKYFESNNNDINYEEVAKMPFLDAVICETLRRHSPASRINRILIGDNNYKLGETGITIEKGHQIIVPVCALHLSPEYYPDPYKFNPDRFLPENRHKLVPYTYLPFGAGPRNCIGMRFALLEAKMNLAYIIKKFKFVTTPNTDIPIEYKRNLGVLKPKRVIIKIQKRYDNSNQI